MRSWEGFGEPTELTKPGVYFVKLPAYKPCEDCGGPQIATFSSSGTGYSCGSSYLHEDGCPTLRCKHDTLWTYGCTGCDAEELLEGDPNDTGDDDE
jgi:hypothetical protein